MPPAVYDVPTFAREVLHVAPITVHRLLRDGKLNCRRIGKRILLTDADAIAFLESNPAQRWEPKGHAGPGRPKKAK